MIEYSYLRPEEKIEKFLEKRIERNKNFAIISVFILMLALIIIFTPTIFNLIEDIKTQSGNISLYQFMPILCPLFLGTIFLTTANNPEISGRQKRYIRYREREGLPVRQPVNYFFMNNKNIKIVNANFVKRTEHGYIFGEERKYLVETGPSSLIEVFFEETPKKGKEYFLICLENYETPIAVFKGRYEGNKYLTWDCK